MNKDLQRFWEWCGLVHIDNPIPLEVANSCEAMSLDRPLNGWYFPDYKKATSKLVSLRDAPVMDLNNLFKYAVPKLKDKLGAMGLFHLLQLWATDITSEDLDPAQALFKAIMKVIDEPKRKG